jgi:amidohydrolase
MTVADPAAARDATLDAWLHEHAEGLIAIRRNIHAHPELSGQEHATTELVSERLELAGLAPRRLAVGTGLVCDLRADDADTGRVGPSPMLALRADLDALAMTDEKDVAYRSQVPGVAHACGHDVHTAVVLGTALYFAHHRDELPGDLRFVFQPAEERVPGGAVDVINERVLDDVDAIIGVHCAPKMDTGSIGIRPGPITSAADMAEIELTGPGGHTARPELTADLVSIAARVVTELPMRVAEGSHDPSHVKVVFGAIHAGDAANVIPSHCMMRASVRTPSTDLWGSLPALFDQALAEIVDGTGATYDLDYTRGVPPVVNDEEMAAVVQRAGVVALGGGSVLEAEQSWGGDDFAWYTHEVPAAFIRLGTHDPTGTGPRLDLHAGHFDVDERAIALGVRVMVATIREYFARPIR